MMTDLPYSILHLRRRPSRLGAALETRKLQEARRLSPAARLALALHLSDLCRELHRSCSPKR